MQQIVQCLTPPFWFVAATLVLFSAVGLTIFYMFWYNDHVYYDMEKMYGHRVNGLLYAVPFVGLVILALIMTSLPRIWGL